MRRVILAASLLGLVPLPQAAGHPANAPAEAVTVTVDASRAVGRINRSLIGLDWKLGTGAAVNDLHPDLARADIAFQDAAKPDGTFDWSFADAWVTEAKAAGAEPMLILDYMPAWLAQTFPGDPRDPTRLRPSNYETWEHIVYKGVEHFALGFGVRFFEVWNEPDWIGFWQDTQDSFLETARHTAIAVQQFERDHGIDVRFGGPACLFPNPGCVGRWLAMMRREEIRPDFVSWHYYGNYPFVGPDGREPSLPEPIWLGLGRTNPAGGVGFFPLGIEVVRGVTAAALAGSGWEMPELILDEWNVSAGGFDRRHDTHAGAAFDAGVLAEFQRERLDRAALLLSKDAYVGSHPGYPCVEGVGDWGLVSCAGMRKPAWWTFWLWGRLAPDEVATTGSATHDGFWALASRDDAGDVTVMLSSFLVTGPHAHAVTLRLAGLATGPMGGEVRRLDAAHASAEAPTETVAVTGPEATLTLTLPPNSVLFLDLGPA